MARTRRWTDLDVCRAVKGAIAGGLVVDRVEIDRDGRIVILTAGARDTRIDDLDRELAAFEAKKHGHAHA